VNLSRGGRALRRIARDLARLQCARQRQSFR